MSKISRSVSLLDGTLEVEAADSFDHLVGFGSRINAQRSFLFISKILGKHYPCTPASMQAAQQQLADKIKPLLKPGPTVVIGFAETATGLGYGVFEALGLPDTYYQHTTRYWVNHPVMVEFKEVHSHAPSHYLYVPENPAHQQLFNTAANIVMVDDEFSTGNTLLNFMAALREKGCTANFIGAGILDWTANRIQHLLPMVSLVQGKYSFTRTQESQSSSFVSEAAVRQMQQGLSNKYGRVGCGKIALDFSQQVDVTQLQNEKVLVLGTGEFMNVAYLLGQYLEANGVEVYVQSTTRSPISLGNAIASRIEMKDNYSENIDNFVYNVADKRYSCIYICYETPAIPATHNLYEQLLPVAPKVIQLFF